jgi:excinuclease ABC subunit C
MEALSLAQSYERAALYRDKMRRLERLRDQFGKMRFALEALSFVYPVAGFGGDDRVYLVRRGTVRAERPVPRSTPERFDLQRLVDEVFQAGEPAKGPVRLHEIDEILLLSSWFRRFPEELGRTWTP